MTPPSIGRWHTQPDNPRVHELDNVDTDTWDQPSPLRGGQATQGCPTRSV